MAAHYLQSSNALLMMTLLLSHGDSLDIHKAALDLKQPPTRCPRIPYSSSSCKSTTWLTTYQHPGCLLSTHFGMPLLTQGYGAVLHNWQFLVSSIGCPLQCPRWPLHIIALSSCLLLDCPHYISSWLPTSQRIHHRPLCLIAVLNLFNSALQ
ncbi:hypothetical protein L7F22_028634 [Adiantum nelumboides]|nr:hypothetical protein [Adiantum nelumboides]